MKKKKTILLCMLVISVLCFMGFSLADEGNVKSVAVSSDSHSVVAVKKSAVGVLNQTSGRKGQNAKVSTADTVGNVKVQKQKPPEIRKVEAQRLIQKYNQTKLRYNNARLRYVDSRDKWVKARDRYRLTKDKAELRNSVTSAQKFVLRADDTVIQYLGLVKTRLELSKSMNESVKQGLVSEINSSVDWFREKNVVLANTTNKKELITHAKEIRDRWRTTRVLVKKTSGLVINSKINSILLKSGRVSEKIEAKIVKLEQGGVDTTELRSLLRDYNGKVGLARERHLEARNRFGEVGDVKGADQLLREGNALIRESNNYLKESYPALKKIIRDFKGDGAK
ncbi:MAG: hypothetical protein U9Q22_02375 [Candidatus Altiarchaeota archaeon]|nr:hypothetical protein [Candidatus Altiarchaeota archaeon]